MAMFYALLALCLSGSALAQIPSLGYCPPVTGQPNFDAAKVTGDWFEYAKYFSLAEIGGRCNEVNFVLLKNGTIRGVNSFMIDFTHKVGAARGDLIPDPEDPARMSCKLELTPLDAISDCWCLGTDYDNYWVAYCCTQYKYFNLQWAWIMTRERLPPKSAIDKSYEIIDNNNVARKPLRKTDQTQCEVKPCA